MHAALSNTLRARRHAHGQDRPHYRWQILIASLVIAAAWPVWQPASVEAATLASGFRETQIARGLNAPTAFALAPDGRIFITLQGGQVRVVKNGSLLATPFLTVETDPSGERGLLGIAFDPNFVSNDYVYIYYTATSPTIHNRISRFTASGDVAVAGSERVVMDLETLNATNHNGGTLHFGHDGKLYVAVGDNAVSSNAQTLANRLGKLLRLNADGSIPNDNPFYATASGNARAIWALGLRNPFKFTFQPGTGRMFINDVGQSSWEEINDGIAGANYGWPDTEGYTTDPRFSSPIYAYANANSPNCAITGGAFYNPETPQFPSQFSGDYFFADYCGGWIRALDPDTKTVFDLASGIASPVDLQVSSDGSLFYLARGATSSGGTLVRIRSSAEQSPTRPAIVRDGIWHLRDSLTSGAADQSFSYGIASDIPLMCDWNGDGTATPGIVRDGVWYLRNSLSSGGADVALSFGLASDTPICGDWDGDGDETPGVVRNGMWYLRNSLTSGVADIALSYGLASDKPLVCDWDGNGTETPGIVRNGVWYLRNSLTSGVADVAVSFGAPSDTPVCGDWDGDGDETPGVIRNGAWYLRNSLTNGVADVSFSYGNPGDMPLVWSSGSGQ